VRAISKETLASAEAKTPEKKALGWISYYYGHSFGGGGAGDWYMYCDKHGSKCGGVLWKFPPARHRKFYATGRLCLNKFKEWCVEWVNP